MKKIITTLIAMAALLICVGPLYAAAEKNKSGHMDQVQNAENLGGMEVVSRDGERIGTITDVNIDAQTGDINFVTLALDDYAGGEFAVPRGALSVGDNQAMLTIDSAKIDDAPTQGFLSDEKFRENLESHYGISPAWKEESDSMDSKY